MYLCRERNLRIGYLTNKFTRKIGKIQQHHTYQPSYQQFNGSNHFTLLKGMEDYHINEMGWSNISQQLTTFPDGKVAVGRPFDTPPEGSFGFIINLQCWQLKLIR